MVTTADQKRTLWLVQYNATFPLTKIPRWMNIAVTIYLVKHYTVTPTKCMLGFENSTKSARRLAKYFTYSIVYYCTVVVLVAEYSLLNVDVSKGIKYKIKVHVLPE